MAELQNHVSLAHKQPKHLTCKECHLSFDESSKYEKHIIENHRQQKGFKCDKCEMSFVLEWRLKKHKKVHHEINARPCHYFNNDKDCPFAIVGCKFPHIRAGVCKYANRCKHVKCQYRHE